MHFKQQAKSELRKLIDLDPIYLENFVSENHSCFLFFENKKFEELVHSPLQKIKKKYDQIFITESFEEVEEQLSGQQNLSLFSESKFLYANLNKKLTEKQIQDLNSWMTETDFEKVVVQLADKATFEKIRALGAFASLGIEDIKFWEFRKLIYFLTNYFGINCGNELTNFIETSFESDFMTYFNVLKNISFIKESNPEITDNQIIKYLDYQAIDKFKLARSLSLKRYHEFFKSLFKLYQIHQYRISDALYFLESHLLKIADPSYLDQKKYHSKYDKEILQYAKSFSPNELKRLLEKMRELQIDSRKKDPLLSLKLISSIQKSF